MQKRRGLAGLALLLVAAGLWYALRPPSSARKAMPSSRPVLTRPQTALSFGRPATASISRVALPSGQLSAADWFLPITAHSSVSYILHDDQARWVVDSRRWSLPQAPADPSGMLSYAPNGMTLGWPGPAGITLITANGHRRLVAHADGVGFMADNRPIVLYRQGLHLSWRQPGHPGPAPITGIPAQSHPFSDHGQWLAVLNGGRLEWVPTAGGRPETAARVKARWSKLIEARQLGSDASAWLLSRPGSLPGYLLLIVRPRRPVQWYRWQSALVPQLVLADRHVLLNQGNGAWVVVGSRHLHTLRLSAGLASDGPYGLIWRSAQGFERLETVTWP